MVVDELQGPLMHLIQDRTRRMILDMRMIKIPFEHRQAHFARIKAKWNMTSNTETKDTQ